MKYTLFLVVLFTACRHSRQEQIPAYDDVILNDRTDPHLLHADAQAHIASLHLSDNKTKEITLRYQEILDKQITPVSVLQLPSEAETDARNKNDLPLYREHVVVWFMDTIQKTLQLSPATDDSGRLGHSEIFHVLAHHLSLLTERQATIKRVFVYSDLQEHSALFDSYSKDGQQLLTLHLDSVVRLFKTRHLLPPRLTSIRVYFIYEPRSREDDRKYALMVDVYRRLLEPLGARVIQQAQNKSFEEVE